MRTASRLYTLPFTMINDIPAVAMRQFARSFFVHSLAAPISPKNLRPVIIILDCFLSILSNFHRCALLEDRCSAERLDGGTRMARRLRRFRRILGNLVLRSLGKRETNTSLDFFFPLLGFWFFFGIYMLVPPSSSSSSFPVSRSYSIFMTSVFRSSGN